MFDRNSLTEEQKQYVIDHALDGLTTYFPKENYKKNAQKEYKQNEIDNIFESIMSKKENDIEFDSSINTASYVNLKTVMLNYNSGKISNNELFNMYFKENILSAEDFIKIARNRL